MQVTKYCRIDTSEFYEMIRDYLCTKYNISPEELDEKQIRVSGTEAGRGPYVTFELELEEIPPNAG